MRRDCAGNIRQMGSALHLVHTFGKLWGARKTVEEVVAGCARIQLALSAAVLHL
jgi:hypothetical protein